MRSSKHREEGGVKIYRVALHGRESPFYEVVFKVLEKKATCICQKFEFVEILYRHILKNFMKKSMVDTIPKHYSHSSSIIMLAMIVHIYIYIYIYIYICCLRGAITKLLLQNKHGIRAITLSIYLLH
jgi:hypothetical protein